MKEMLMNRIQLTVCFTLLLVPLSGLAEEHEQAEVEARFITGPTNGVAAALSLIDSNKMTGTKLDLSALPASWKVISSPMLITLLGQPAEIYITEQPSQYFVKQSDGCFQLHQMRAEDGEGLTLNITSTRGPTKDSLELKVKVKYRCILKREELPDVSLDVGAPIFHTREYKFDIALDPGTWWVNNLSDFTNPGTNITDQAMLMMLRVRRVDASGLPIDAHGQSLPP
jgi:hypothetical protein